MVLLSRTDVPTGAFWYGDLAEVGGQRNVCSSGSTIANTQTPYPYQSERFIANSTLPYKYYVPNGTYNVTLKFAEIDFSTAGNRVMNVSINGTTVLPNFDIVAQAGPNTATDHTFPVTVSTGSITISFATSRPWPRTQDQRHPDSMNGRGRLLSGANRQSQYPLILSTRLRSGSPLANRETLSSTRS